MPIHFNPHGIGISEQALRAFVLVIIHMYWVGLSRFKSITSQNPSQSYTIHSNTHVISITEQALSDLFLL
jgi:hypothetical protein